jgi:hypothetical protein
MSNYYDAALHALTQMNTALVQLNADINALQQHLNQAVAANHFVSREGPAWVQWANALALREKHKEWGRKIHGVMMGYEREMQSGWKHLKKGRSIGFVNADVTVGGNEAYAKAVQHKHTVSPDNSAVNEMIAKAANQLTGESGEAPLPTQRKIIDVMINEPTNWWPFDAKDLGGLDEEVQLNDGIIPFDLLKSRGAEQILKQLTRYKYRSKGLNAATQNSLYNVVPQHGALNLKHGPSGPKTTSVYAASGQKIELLTIKMIYGQPRKFWNGAGVNPVVVSKMVFVAYRLNGRLDVAFLKHNQ